MNSKPDSSACGDIFFASGLDALGTLLAASGMPNSVGAYAIRLNNFPSSFEIAWVGNLSPESPYEVDCCGYGMPHEAVALWGARLAAALQANGIFPPRV
ncbi:hypothetical protein [Massilia genomosp. 1]|uniref:Uncharacterized protein n=1 Tax=Massilia genomosp. 1 TaxID=2609280 RepID=A0ABX0MQC4_9BURK|nr:hypothetical protein [Massilia genomosp. 1]NHZ61537.1 hypothetical protein [Massilia genomosp. 1]